MKPYRKPTLDKKQALSAVTAGGGGSGMGNNGGGNGLGNGQMMPPVPR